VNNSPVAAPVNLPPASSQIGVNETATRDRDLNDFGSRGVPVEILEKREKAKTEALAAKAASFYMYGETSSSLISAKTLWDVLSVLWLIAVLAGCYFFMSRAFEGANRKFRFGAATAEETKPLTKTHVENMRIDREAYVYVDGG
jgi:hypothetical protein